MSYIVPGALQAVSYDLGQTDVSKLTVMRPVIEALLFRAHRSSEKYYSHISYGRAMWSGHRTSAMLLSRCYIKGIFWLRGESC